MILSIILVDLITNQKQNQEKNPIYSTLSETSMPVMQKKRKPLLYILLQYYSFPFFLFVLSFSLLSSAFGRDVNLLIQCFIRLRVTVMLHI